MRIPTCIGPLLCLALAGTALAGSTPAAQFKAEYALYIKGVKVAKMERRFSSSADGSYVYRSNTRTTGLFSLFRDDHITEESRGRLLGDGAQPLRYDYSHTGSHKQRRVSMRFDWGRNEVVNLVNGSPWKMHLQAGVLDKLLYQYVIMQDLSAGKRRLSYVIADGGKTKVYDFEPQGEEIIDTPLGRLRTLKLTRHKPNSRRETTLWCALDLQYLPVKVKNIEKDNKITVAIIQSLSGLGR